MEPTLDRKSYSLEYFFIAGPKTDFDIVTVTNWFGYGSSYAKKITNNPINLKNSIMELQVWICMWVTQLFRVWIIKNRIR